MKSTNKGRRQVIWEDETKLWCTTYYLYMLLNILCEINNGRMTNCTRKVMMKWVFYLLACRTFQVKIGNLHDIWSGPNVGKILKFRNLFSSIDFYSEDTVNNQGLECLRFLNEVISDFDAVSTPYDQFFCYGHSNVRTFSAPWTSEISRRKQNQNNRFYLHGGKRFESN